MSSAATTYVILRPLYLQSLVPRPSPLVPLSRVSISREIDQGPKATLGVAIGPQNLGPKISQSLVYNPLGVNKPIPFGARKKPEQMLGGGLASSRWSGIIWLTKLKLVVAPQGYGLSKPQDAENTGAG